MDDSRVCASVMHPYLILAGNSATAPTTSIRTVKRMTAQGTGASGPVGARAQRVAAWAVHVIEHARVREPPSAMGRLVRLSCVSDSSVPVGYVIILT